MLQMILLEHVSVFFFFNDTATTEIYTLSLHDALPILNARASMSECSRTCSSNCSGIPGGRSSSGTSVDALAARSEEHTSELQSRQYLVCRLLLEKKNTASTRTSGRRRSPCPSRSHHTS